MSGLALGVPLTVVTVLGLLVNGYILLVVLVTKQAHTANSLLLLHLGAVDALLCVVFLLFPAPGLLLRAGAGASWLGASPAACTAHGFLITLLHPVALWTVCGLHCDRYCAIAAPLHYGALVSARRVAAGLAAAWAASLAVALPPLFLAAPAYRYSAAQAGCAPDGGAALWYSAAYAVLALLLPTAVILACNIKVLMIARYHRHRIASAIFEVALSAQVTIMHQRNPLAGAAAPAAVAARSLYRGRNAVPTVLQLLAACVLLYAPATAPTPRVVARAVPPAASCGPANLFLQRVFGAGGADKEASLKRAAAIQTVLCSPRRSPRILITRAFSEESDHSPPATAASGDLADGGMGRKYSTSTTSLLDRRWRLALDAKERDAAAGAAAGGGGGGDEDDDGAGAEAAEAAERRCLQGGGGGGGSGSLVLDDCHARCIDSSSDEDCDCSDASSGRLFFSLDCAGGRPQQQGVAGSQLARSLGDVACAPAPDLVL